MNKPGIVIIGPTPPPYAGPEMNTVNILNSEVLKDKFELHHLNTQKHTRNAQKGTISLQNILLEIKHALKLISLIVLKNPTTVFLPVSQTDLGFMRDSVFILLGKALFRKVTLYLGGGAYDEFIKNSRFPGFVRFVFNASDIIIVLSNRVKKQMDVILKSGSGHKIRLIPVDITLPEPSNRFSPSKKGAFRVLHLGHVSVAKGALDLVKAIPGVLEKFPDTKFLFAGDFINNETNITFIPDPHNAETKIKTFLKDRGIEDKVEFLGFVAGKDKTSLLNSVDVQVLASYSEGTPRSVFEGMLSGLPVVVTPCGNLEEVVQNNINGFIVNYSSPEEISARIIELLENPELRSTVSGNNRKLIEEAFSKTKRFAALSETFQYLAQKHRSIS